MPEQQMTPDEIRRYEALQQELVARGMAPTLGPPESLRAPTIGAQPAPSWDRNLLEFFTGYPASDTREMGPIETVTTLAAAVPGVGAVRAGAKAAKRAKAGVGAIEELGAAMREGAFAGKSSAVPEFVRNLFPRLDKYGKATSRISAPTILKRLEAAPSVTPEAKTALEQLAADLGTRRVSADELHALSKGETFTPDRVLRKVKAPVEGTTKRKGAPLGVTTARQEKAAREKYMKGMETGVEGRDWYKNAGESIRFHANDDPLRAMNLAEDISITSPATTVSANTGFGVKGYNQATAGVPIEAGRFPTAMGKQIAAGHAGETGATGLKRTPFAQNLARGGDFLGTDVAARPVNDIWQGEMFGYVNEDGTPLRRGFTPAEHGWMDTQSDKIVEEANARALGGFTDWDLNRSQASGWVGAKVNAGQIKPEDAARAYHDYFPDLYAQGSRETVPGATTGHMPELLKPDAAQERQLLHEMMTRESGIYDAQGRDQITAGYGGLVGRGFEGPGAFQGATSPGWQTQVLTGSLEAPGGPSGARVLDEGSRRIMDASEATHGLLMGQDASAYSRILPAGSGATRTGWDVALPGGTVDPEQMQALIKRLGAGANDAVLVPTPDGVRLAQMDEGTMKALVKELGGKVKTAGTLQGNYLPNNWQAQRVGQDYLEPIQKMGSEKFDAFAPAMAERLRGVDARFAKETKGRFTLSPVMDEVRATIAGEGFKGLERLAKKYAIPVTLLVASLGELVESVPQPDSAL